MVYNFVTKDHTMITSGKLDAEKLSSVSRAVAYLLVPTNPEAENLAVENTGLGFLATGSEYTCPREHVGKAAERRYNQM
jgi:hypothetical protein